MELFLAVYLLGRDLIFFTLNFAIELISGLSLLIGGLL